MHCFLFVEGLLDAGGHGAARELQLRVLLLPREEVLVPLLQRRARIIEDLLHALYQRSCLRGVCCCSACAAWVLTAPRDP